MQMQRGKLIGEGPGEHEGCYFYIREEYPAEAGNG